MPWVKYSRKRKAKKSYPSKAPLSRQVAKLSRTVSNLAKPELKYNDNGRTAPANVGFDLNTVNDALCTPAQGDGQTQRDGSAINMHKLYVQGKVNANSAQAEPYVVRIIVLQAKQRYSPSLTATTGVTQLLEDANTNDAVHSMYSFVNRVHYRILKDFKITVQSTGTSGGAAPDIKYFKFGYTFKKFNRTMRFDSNGTTSQMNQIYFLAVSTAGTTNYPTIEYEARTTFYDN